MIPKVIHTCWFTKKKDFILSDKIKKCIESWKTHCTDYEIKIWTIEDWPEMKEIPHAKSCWEAGVASYAYLSNIFRFWVLYNHGGFYVEADVLLKKSLNDFLNDTVVLGEINPNEISGNLMGSIKNHPLMKRLFDKTSEKIWINKDQSLNLYHDTGFLGEQVKEFGCDFPVGIKEKMIFKDISIYPKNYFVPTRECDGIYSCHLGTLSHYRKLSIIMPVYNSEKYLKEAIDSILLQDFTDYELLCIDDGSTDSSSDIIKSYDDDRIVYIKKEHSGIVDSLNIGIRRSIGLYIVRMDSDDIMLPGRLEHQYSYMKNHPDVDILSSGFQWGNGKETPEYWRPRDRYIQLRDFIVGNVLAHPAVIFKRNSILSLPYFYENYFQGCEDYKLWSHALLHGLTIKTEPTPVIIYRQHEGQETEKKDYHSIVNPLVEQVKRMYTGYKNEKPESIDLTCIIPFQNEGSEIERTVANIRGTAGAGVKIMLINDASTDNYDYAWISRNYDCQYFYNGENLGVAGSRDFGVNRCSTKYFVLLDGHMRFYKDNWHIDLIKELDNNPGCLVTANTIVFSYDKDTKIYSNEEGLEGRTDFGSYGAIVNLKEPGWEFTGKWTKKILSGYGKDDPVIPISCCMGAVYAASKEFWKKIGGLQGLKKYGSDESLMSLKTWLSGGKVLLMKDWGVGHLYRGNSPYSVPLKSLDQNHLYLINLFCKCEEDIKRYESNLRDRIGVNRFNLAQKEFDSQKEELMRFKEYFFNNIATRDLNWFIENINNNLI